MKQAPPWTPEEFEILLCNPGASPEALVLRLSRRSVGAIETVRQAIHAYHNAGDFAETGLSLMMRERLDPPRSLLTCAVCGAPFSPRRPKTAPCVGRNERAIRQSASAPG